MSMSDVAPPTLEAALGQVRIIAAEPHLTTIDYEVEPRMCHSGGVAQGGFVRGWIDAAMAHAVMTDAPEMTPLSLEVKVSYFSPARPGRVIAEGWIERRGRTTCFAAGRLLGPGGEVLAKASSTIRLIQREKVEARTRRGLELA